MVHAGLRHIQGAGGSSLQLNLGYNVLHVLTVEFSVTLLSCLGEKHHEHAKATKGKPLL